MVQILIVVKGVKSFQYQDLVIMTPHFKCQNITWNGTFRLLFMTTRRSRTEMEKTLFKQGGPFSTKAGIHRGPVSRYKLFIEITKYNI